MPVALENPYCSLLQLQQEIKNTDAGLEDQLHDAINRASRWIDDYRRCDFFQHDYSSSALVLDRFDECVFDEKLFLPYRPVIEVTEVKVCGETWVSGTDYVVKSNTIISLRGSWPIANPPTDVAAIKCKLGYVQASSAAVPTGLPKVINQACILVAAAFCGHNVKDHVSLDGTKTAVNDRSIPKSVYDMLGKRQPILT
jgi:hypothetical protein